MKYLFTSESVSEGHPDKIADQISDAVLDEYLRHDPDAKVACETMVTTGLVICSGEVKSNFSIDLNEVVRKTIRKIGYTKSEYKFDAESCGIISTLHAQSGDINQGVVRANPEEQGAGDQGMMFGYASREMENYMPLPIELAHKFLMELAIIRKEGAVMKYLRPDAKSQVSVEYSENGNPLRIDTIVISTQHDEFILPENDSPEAKKNAENEMQSKIKADIKSILIPRVTAELADKTRFLFKEDYNLLVNPTGKFVIGGPHGDTGLTGRKIIVDTYGGKGAHGGGAFSGKDSSKVDRSAAYAARHIAKNIVAAGIAEKALIQVAYAIGKAHPVGIFINTYGTANVVNSKGEKLKDSEIAEVIYNIFDLRPYSIVKRLGLNNPVFEKTSTYGHFGRKPYIEETEVFYQDENTYAIEKNGKPHYYKKVEYFSWEKLDFVDVIRQAFNFRP